MLPSDHVYNCVEQRITTIIVMIVNSIVVIINIEFGILPEFMLLPQMFSKGEKDPKRTHPNRLFILNH